MLKFQGSQEVSLANSEACNSRDNVDERCSVKTGRIGGNAVVGIWDVFITFLAGLDPAHEYPAVLIDRNVSGCASTLKGKNQIYGYLAMYGSLG